jgi:N-hydroxyarylamine O-acetyltransferase
MSTDDWQVDRLDLDGYLRRLGVPAREPSRAALAELHEAHVRAFTFDNIEVLLDQHPASPSTTSRQSRPSAHRRACGPRSR